MDEQLYTMRVNLFDSLLGVVLALVTVPLFGIRGYILNLILCEVINFSLSVSRLSKKLRPRYFLLDNLLLPLLAGVISAFLVRHLASVFMLSGGKGALFFLMAIAAGLYLLTLRVLRKMQNVKCRMQNAKRKKSSA